MNFRQKIVFVAIFTMTFLLIIISIVSYTIIKGIVLDNAYRSNYNYIKTVSNSFTNFVKESKIKLQLNSTNLKEMYSYYMRLESIHDKAQYGDSIELELQFILENNKEFDSLIFITPLKSFSIGPLRTSVMHYNNMHSSRVYEILKNTLDEPVLIPWDYIEKFSIKKNDFIANGWILIGQRGMHEGQEYFFLGIVNLADFIAGEKYGSVIVCAPGGDILWSNDRGVHGSVFPRIYERLVTYKKGDLIFDREFFVTHFKSLYQELYFFNIIPMEILKQDLKHAYAFIWIGCIFTGMLFILLVLVFSRKLMHPLISINEAMKKIGDFETLTVDNDTRNNILFSWFRRISFRNKLVIFFCFHVITPSIFILVLVFMVAFSTITAKVRQAVEIVVEQASSNISYVISNIQQISVPIALYNDVQTVLIEDTGTAELQKYQKSISENILQQGIVREGAAYINIYRKNGEPIYQSSNINTNKRDFISRIGSLHNEPHIISGWLESDMDNSGGIVYPYVKRVLAVVPSSSYHTIRNTSSSKKIEYYSHIGYVEIGLLESGISDQYYSLRWGPDSAVYIVDNTGTIASHQDKQLIRLRANSYVTEELLNGSNAPITKYVMDKLVLIYPIKNAIDWRLVAEIPMGEIVKDSYKILTYNIFFMLGIIVLIVILSYVISSRMVSPLTAMESRMRKADISGEDEVRVWNGKTDEVTALVISFNQMMKRLKVLVDENYMNKIIQKELEASKQELERRKNEAELIAFQSQINPHFLYNTFTSIRFMTLMGKGEEAAEMLDSVGRLFRKGVYRGEVIVDINEEIEHVRAYVEIQKKRYADKLEVLWEIDEQLTGYKILKLTLQPLVENSIYHGIEVKDGKGTLIIKGEKIDDKLYFSVTDDGVGMDTLRLKEVRMSLNESRFNRGIGLKNVDERIKLYFGEDYGLEIDSRKNMGTKVTMCIPIVK